MAAKPECVSLAQQPADTQLTHVLARVLIGLAVRLAAI